MADSIENAHNISLLRRKPVGHIYKGHSTVAATASIPTKYKTIVIKNDEKRGFNSCSRRFSNASFNDSPGPAKYDVTKDKLIENNASISRKGLGGFVSKVKRFPVRLNQDNFVGPGQYDPKPSSFHDFNKAQCTRNFHKPIVTSAKDIKQNGTPAPNHYNLVSNWNKSFSTSGQNKPAFMTRAKRDWISDKKEVYPSPGSYDIKDDFTHANIRAAQAPFRSTTDRTFLSFNSEYPGPGAYHPFEETHIPEKKKLPRKHYLCMSAPAIPMPPILPTPGPGQYNLVDYDGPAKEYMSTSVFVSTTNRWNGKHHEAPGPGKYNPREVGKQSFIYNTQKKWI